MLQFPSFLLLIATVLCFISYAFYHRSNLALGIVVLFLSFFNACLRRYLAPSISYSGDSIRNLYPRVAKVIRDGSLREIELT